MGRREDCACRERPGSLRAVTEAYARTFGFSLDELDSQMDWPFFDIWQEEYFDEDVCRDKDDGQDEDEKATLVDTETGSREE